MKYCFSAVSAKSGGAATYLANLVKDLRSGSDRYVLLVPTGTLERLATCRADVEITETDIAFKSPLRRLVWDQIKLRGLLKRRKIDLLVSTSDFGLFFSPCPQILLVRNSLFFSKPYREFILPKKRLAARLDYWLRHLLVRASIWAADLVVMASAGMLAQVISDFPATERKAVVNTFGAPLEKFSGQRTETTDRMRRMGAPLRLLYVSEYADYKNLGTLLKALMEFNRDHANKVTATVTMDPGSFKNFDSVTKEEDLQLAMSADLAGVVEFVGGVPYERIEQLYRQSDIFVFPSMAESFGHPLVEAMASGLPVIASDIPVHREVCGNAAMYFEPSDFRALAACIRKLVQDADVRRVLGDKGRQNVGSLLSWRDHVRRLEALMREVALRGRV